MELVNENDKNKIIQFIKENDLDYTHVDNGITKPHMITYDGYKLFFYIYESTYVMVKYDSDKDKPGGQAYEYFYFDTMPKLLEQLKHYDQSIRKVYWHMIIDSISYPFDKLNYKDDWFTDLLKDEFYSIEEDVHCKYVVYENDKYKPIIKSPYNTLDSDHLASQIHSVSEMRLNKLYFEIHPISTLEGSETYMLKVLFNDDDLFKEYINYRVVGKKGLRLIIESLFNESNYFKI